MSVKKLILAQFHKHTISLCSSLEDLLQGYCQSQMNNLDHNQLEREESPSGNWLSTFFSYLMERPEPLNLLAIALLIILFSMHPGVFKGQWMAVQLLLLLQITCIFLSVCILNKLSWQFNGFQGVNANMVSMVSSLNYECLGLKISFHRLVGMNCTAGH